ncbi:hypothetical protein OV090_38990 [Nannocystis sp. RBIL2]|uniref:hypothetical protein n=1 Tax=Nannocystis sp. RBIL2 TaxID=2996788 RepID=UPI002272261C|nr:hypothetical protein [Nannocystis sp. RBIL2]MCY1070793.1 hypothetical protein [Nannocystis sp. RBIL2]
MFRSPMTLHRRLLLFGAVIPAGLIALALFLIGLVLDHLLLESVDRGLTLQAASESVSLFDRPGQDAHLHFGDSALVADLQRLHHQGALYGPDGARLLAYPAETFAPERLTAADVARAPALQTRALASGERVRELSLAIDSPRGEPHALWLAVSLASNDAALAAYARAAALIGAAVTLLMLLLQVSHARGLVHRVQQLHVHMQRLQTATSRPCRPPTLAPTWSPACATPSPTPPRSCAPPPSCSTASSPTPPTSCGPRSPPCAWRSTSPCGASARPSSSSTP